jgi:hypothetical protein
MSNASDFLKSNIGLVTLGSVSALAGGAVGYYAGKRSVKRKKTKRKASSTHRKSSYKRRKQKKPHTAGKRRDTSHRRIRYTKNNQPYIILASGKARFISKKNVRNSRKRKGGRY